MTQKRLTFALIAAALFAVAAFFCVPLGLEANDLLLSEDDPVAISDRALSPGRGARGPRR